MLEKSLVKGLWAGWHITSSVFHLRFLLLLICGLDWLYQPTFLVCIIVGVATTAAPWFMMQPAFGFGIAASKTPKPVTARLRSLQAHAIYGFGLYIAHYF